MKQDSAMVGAPVYERVENDFYPTETPATAALYDYLRERKWLFPSTTVVEPACGDGAISKVFEERGHKVWSSDLYPQYAGASVNNFLTFDWLKHFGDGNLFVTNPPYAREWIDLFIEKCIELAEGGNTCALLMRNEVDCAKSRIPYFRECPEFSAKAVLTWRPRWIPGSTGSPRHNYAWYIWRPASVHDRRQATITYLERPGE